MGVRWCVPHSCSFPTILSICLFYLFVGCINYEATKIAPPKKEGTEPMAAPRWKRGSDSSPPDEEQKSLRNNWSLAIKDLLWIVEFSSAPSAGNWYCMLLVYPPIFNGNFRILKWRFCTIFLARYLRFLKWPLTQGMVWRYGSHRKPSKPSVIQLFEHCAGNGLIWVYIRKLHPFTNQNQNE